MEIKVNRDIRKYSESMFFGLTLRQVVFSITGCLSSLIVYFFLKNTIKGEILYWFCMLSVVPHAFFGFFTYNLMNAETVLYCAVKSCLTGRRILQSGNTNLYYSLIFEKDRKGGVYCLNHLKRR